MNKSTKEGIQEHFEQFSLSDEQFAFLNGKQEEAWREEKKNRPKLPWYQRTQFTFSLMGAAALFLVIGLQWNLRSLPGTAAGVKAEIAYNQSLMDPELTIRQQIAKELKKQQIFIPSSSSRQGLSQNVSYSQATPNPISLMRGQIAREIAYHHNKNLDLEIKSNNLNRIHGFYGKLDFPLVKPALLKGKNWKLLGGRYSSIQQRLAAHMKLLNESNNQIYSLYQYKLTQDSILNSYPEPWQVYMDGVQVTLWVEKGILHGIARDL